ncbi:MAG TPA: hypothetical protein VI485_26080 [Vicinamibacterales bacterium]|nr:hypothetical protein [Vicinamibacterales bacterium]
MGRPGRTADSFSARLPVWLLTTALLAIACSVAVGYFKHDFFEVIPAPPELQSEVMRRIVFVLAFIVAGVTVQALWWVLRRVVLSRKASSSS